MLCSQDQDILFIVIIFKLGFLISTLAFKYFKLNNLVNKETMETMQKIKDQFLTVSEVFMYLVLIIALLSVFF